MFELIPSDHMKNLFEKKGFQFSDFQKATLIWNMPNQTWERKIAALKELEAETKDDDLKGQIYDRITYEIMALRKFKENIDGRYVYVVESADSYSCGFFAEYSIALEYLKRYSKENETRCTLRKQLIVRDEKDMRVKSTGRWNPNIFKDVKAVEYEEYDGHAAARISFEMNGEIRAFYSYEMTEEQEQAVDEFRKERFENHFMKIPFEGQKGAIVRDISLNNLIKKGTEGWEERADKTYGILMTDMAEWEEYMHRIEERDLYVDFSDVQVIVYSLTEQGNWVHDHVNPLYLEVEKYPCREGDKKSELYQQALEAFGDYWTGTLTTRGEELKSYYDERAIACTKAYRDICLQRRMELEKQKDTRIDRAETLDDVLI